MNDKQDFVKWLRDASPYLTAHRERCFVIHVSGQAFSDGGFVEIVQDITLLTRLGARVVLIYGAEPQIKARLVEQKAQIRQVDDLPVTDARAMACVKEVVGLLRVEIESLFSAVLASHTTGATPMRLINGNLVVARPLGVRNGVDHLFSGEVRRLDAEAIKQYLNDGAVVLLSPLGYSPTGEVFALPSEELATVTAAELHADKLLFLTELPRLRDEQGKPLPELEPVQAVSIAQADWCSTEHRRHLALCVRACRAGVHRAHLVPRHLPGALLQELYSRDGVGTLVTAEHYESLRDAHIDDVSGIMALIRPLEADGSLVQRSRESLELDIDNFVVMERDGMIVACASLHEYAEEGIGEIACVAVHPDYRKGRRGEKLLEHLERRARQLGLKQLFVLTTRAAHWFMGQGFVLARITDLPVHKQTIYNYQRNSKVFIKPLQAEGTRVAR